MEQLITDNVILGNIYQIIVVVNLLQEFTILVFFQLFITTLTMGLFIKIPVLHDFLHQF